MHRAFATSPEPTIGDVLTEVRAVRGLLERLLESRSPLSRRDRETLERLLPVITGVFGSELILAADLFDDPPPALKLVTRALNAKKVGRLFRRADGQPIGGFVVQCEGAEAGACLWRVLAVVGS